MEKRTVILISEDDLGHFILLKNRLRKAGLDNDIVHLPDGQETIDFLYNTGQSPGRDTDLNYVLLLDIRMPKVDGIEVLRRIRSDTSIDNMPIAMITSSGDPENVRCCSELGCDAYIVKPIDEVALKTIANLCSTDVVSAGA